MLRNSDDFRKVYIYFFIEKFESIKSQFTADEYY